MKSDIAFIQSSWGSSYYKGAGYIDYVSPQELHEYHRPRREAFIQDQDSAVIVCSDIEDETHILGWCAVTKPKSVTDALILHYVYVKEAYKHRGIAQELLKQALPMNKVIYTHLTERAHKIMRKYPRHFATYTFKPHLF